MELLKELSPIVAIVSTVIAIIIGIGTLKQRRNEPQEKRFSEIEAHQSELDAWRREQDTWRHEVEAWRHEMDACRLEMDIWRREVNEKLDRDNRKIKSFEDEFAKNDEFRRLMLKSIKGLVSSSGDASVGNISQEIDDFLIRR